ncbi:MAG: hypothetical protein ACI9MC_001406 [Kiritimatiellia bacterium]
MFLFLLASLVIAAPLDGDVTMDGKTWARLVASPPISTSEGHGPAAVSRQVKLRWDGEVTHVEVRWRIEAQKQGWWRERLAGPGVLVERVTWNGRAGPTSSNVEGTFVTGRVTGPVIIVLVGTLKGDPSRAAVPVELAKASLGTVQIEAGALRGRIQGADVVPVDELWWASGSSMSVQVSPPKRSARSRRSLAVAFSGVGLTVGEGELLGKARLEWRLRQGELSAVSFTAQHVGADLDVVGPGVTGWQRNGDRVTVRLDKAVHDVVHLDLRWSSSLSDSGQAQVPTPLVVPADAFRVQSTLQLAKDSELEVVPELSGWTPIASSKLDDFGTGLIEGTPTAAYKIGGKAKPGQLSLLRFVPVAGPQVMVDVAAYTMTASAEGRSLTRALYTVRNERAGNLRFRPPTGHRVIGVRVAGQTAFPARTGAEWVIPLPRSIETVEGLVSFPVEVILLGQVSRGWARREDRQLPLPQIGAPVAVNRVTLTLPPTWADELEEGEHGRVEAFSEGEGIAYGFGVGGAAEAKADQAWQDAMGAYMSNEFDKADRLLDTLDEMGADNENLGRLRSNLDVVQGRAVGGETAMTRRVVAQASSRGEEDRRQREEVLREAEEELESGNYEQAVVSYKKAEALSNKLSKVQQRESVEEQEKARFSNANVVKAEKKMKQRTKDQAVYRSASEVQRRPANKRVVDDKVGGKSDAGQDRVSFDDDDDDGAGGDEADASGFFDFDGVEISGELAKPQGGYVLDDEEEPSPAVDSTIYSGLVVVSADTEDRVMTVEVRKEAVPRVSVSAIQDVSVVGGRRPVRALQSRRGGGRGLSGAKDAPAAPPPPPVALPAEMAGSLAGSKGSGSVTLAANGVTFSSSADAFEPLKVSSTSLSVVVPVLGQTVRYQHLLLPVDAELVVHVRARAPRSSVRSVK